MNGDGHLGRLNLTNSYYYAFGRDSRNPIAGRSVRVKSHMAAVEASVDKDYLRFRGSFFWAQGDQNPTDEKGTGFDAICDDPNFVGGQFSFWNRNGIRLTQTGVGLVQPNSILPSLRSSKTQGQSNFVNPGIFIYNAGFDVEVTQRIKAVFNANYLRFHRTEPLEYLLFQNRIRHDIGFDYSLGVAYRPFLINNVQITFGASTLQTGRGFRDIFTDRPRNCPPNVGDFCEPDVINPRKPLYSLFAQLKFIFGIERSVTETAIPRITRTSRPDRHLQRLLPLPRSLLIHTYLQIGDEGGQKILNPFQPVCRSGVPEKPFKTVQMSSAFPHTS